MSFSSDRTIQEALPAGVIFPYAGSTAPAGWLLCNTDTPISVASYPRLYAAIGNTYNAGSTTPGNGTTTFNIPNMAGVFVRGAGSRTISGTVYSGTRGNSQVDAYPSHNHGGGSHTHNITNYFYDGSGMGYQSNSGQQRNFTNKTSDSSGSIISSNGSGTETKPANICTNYIIKI